MTHPEPEVNAYLARLTQLLRQSHSPDELIFLCQALSIDHEALPADTPNALAGELIIHLFRRHRLSELITHLRKTHPTTTWPAIPEIVHLASLPPEDRLQLAAELDHVPEPAITAPAGSRLPLPRNPFFTGRLADLQFLIRAIVTGHTVAITGLGGVGKSQLAVEFAHRYGRYFAGGVFWLSFADPAAISAEIAACGGPSAMNLPGLADLPLPEQARQVQAAWLDGLPRLLIFDNCEDPDLLAQYRPPSPACRLLLTSRNQTWQQQPLLAVEPLILGILPRPETVSLLRRYLPALADQDAAAIAAELGDLPLAIHLAGSFLATYRRTITPVDYLQQLQAMTIAHESLAGRGTPQSPTQHEQHVARTFDLSYRRLLANERADDPAALTLLHRAACLAPGDPIPLDLLFALLPIPIEEVVSEGATSSPIQNPPSNLFLEDLLQRLEGLGLLEPAGDQGFRLHRLLAHFITAQDAEAGQTQQLVGRAVIDFAIELEQSGRPLLLLPWLPHLHHLVAGAAGREDEASAYVQNQLGYLLQSLGDYATAHPYLERALAIRERVLGTNHPHTATSLNNLGYLFGNLGDYATAQRYYERALAIWEQVLGPDHPDTALGLNNLGAVLDSQGNYAAARPYYERALAICEQVLGPDHPDTARSLNNLGYLLQNLGDYSAARPYYERALAIRERTLGPEHHHTALSLTNLGYLLQSQGDYNAARPYYERALAILEHVLGPDHPDTANALNNLGYLWQSLGEYDAARPYYERALAIRERVLGPNHSDTATSLNNLGTLLDPLGEYDAARPYYERALTIREHVLGPDHPDTAVSLNNLGTLLHSVGDYATARLHHERALAIRDRILGPYHPETAISLNNLGTLLSSQGDYDTARPYYERALAINERVLGPDHPETALILSNLGDLFSSQGNYDTARPYYERALAIRERVLGPDHPNTINSLANLGYLLDNQGEYAAAQLCLERVLAIRERLLGPDHPDTAESLIDLGTLFRHQGDYAAARPYYERALAIRERVLGRDHLDTATSLNSLAVVLDNLGNYDAARPYYERALAIRERLLGPDHPHTDVVRRNLASLPTLPPDPL